jgi:hypothetical protein
LKQTLGGETDLKEFELLSPLRMGVKVPKQGPKINYADKIRNIRANSPGAMLK